MPEPVIAQQKVGNQPQPQTANQVKPPEPVGETVSPEDIISRSAKVVINQPKQDDDYFNFNDIEKISDPVAKEQAIKAYKSFERGYQKKFQDLAELRRSLEQAKASNSQWSPEKVQSLLNDPSFVNAAKQVAGNGQVSEDDSSVLSERERATLLEMKKQMDMFAQQNNQLLRQKQHEELKQRYPNYSPDVVENTFNDYVSGKIQGGLEHIWKVVDYEDGIKRAYHLGRQDERQGIQTNVNASSFQQSPTVVPQQEPPKRQEKESSKAFLERILATNMMKRGS